MSDQQKSLKQIMDFRLEKLDQLINNGINPYPVKFNPTHLSNEIIENFSEYEGRRPKNITLWQISERSPSMGRTKLPKVYKRELKPQNTNRPIGNRFGEKPKSNN